MASKLTRRSSSSQMAAKASLTAGIERMNHSAVPDALTPDDAAMDGGRPSIIAPGAGISTVDTGAELVEVIETGMGAGRESRHVVVLRGQSQ